MVKITLCSSIVIVYYLLDAAADSIDHAKGARYLLELWHLIKGARSAIMVLVCTWYVTGSIIYSLLLLIPLMTILGFLWEVTYGLCHHFELYRLDDRLSLPLLRRLWHITDDRRDR